MITRTLALVYRDLTVGARVFASVILSAILSIVMYLVVAGLAYDSLIGYVRLDSLKVPYIEFLIPGIIAIVVMEVSYVTGTKYWIDRRTGMFEQLVACVCSKTEYFIALMITAQLLSLALATLALAIAYLIYPTMRVTLLARSLVAIPLEAALFCSIGMIVALLVKTSEMYNITLNMIMPLFFISTAFYPLYALPLPLRYIALANPLTYVVETMRNLAYSPSNVLHSSVPLIVLTVATLAILVSMVRKLEITD